MLELEDRRCLIVGGGEVALRKAQRLVKCGAEVVVIAPEVLPRLREMKGVTIHERPFQRGDTTGFALVFACAGDPEVNAAASREAHTNGILVNTADDPERCSFLAPAVVRRGDVVIAVSTCGRSPALSRRIREEIEQNYGPEYGQFAELLGSLRGIIKSKYPAAADRKSAFRRMLDRGILELLRQGKTDEAHERALECI